MCTAVSAVQWSDVRHLRSGNKPEAQLSGEGSGVNGAHLKTIHAVPARLKHKLINVCAMQQVSNAAAHSGLLR